MTLAGEEFVWALYGATRTTLPLNTHLHRCFMKAGITCPIHLVSIKTRIEYADILCIMHLQCLKERRDSFCKTKFRKIKESIHRLNNLISSQICNTYNTCMCTVRIFNEYPLPCKARYPKSVRNVFAAI